jgi:hypothetical protein
MAQPTKSRLELASIASTEARLLAWEVDLCAGEFAVVVQGMGVLTHGELFF